MGREVGLQPHLTPREISEPRQSPRQEREAGAPFLCLPSLHLYKLQPEAEAGKGTGGGNERNVFEELREAKVREPPK